MGCYWPSVRGRWCSPVMAGEDEKDSVRPMVSSPKHEWWHDGGRGGRWKKCITRALERGRELKSVGRRCSGGRGSTGVYIGHQEAPGRGNVRWLMVLTPLMAKGC
jgi:hypothetical protein